MENKKKKYEYLRNLDKKILKFITENYNKESNAKPKKFGYVEPPALENLIWGTHNYHVKLDLNNFCAFLANVLKIKPEEIKKLFGEDIDLFKNVDENGYFKYDENIISEIENRYNANVNCFNLTGKYIQDLDSSIFDIKFPDYSIIDYAKITGLYSYEDMMNVYNTEKTHSSTVVNSPVDNYEIDLYDGKYSYYALFSRKDIPDNFQDKILNTCYLKNLFDKIGIENKYDYYAVCYHTKIFISDNNLKINDNPKIFKEAIDKIVMFFINQYQKYGKGFEYDNEKYDDEYKKLISEISEKYCINYQDKDELIKEEGKGSY